jgi:UDP-N-acetylmuramate dehydrogenase
VQVMVEQADRLDPTSPELPLEQLRKLFAGRLQEKVSLARFTSARIGGPADALVIANNAEELSQTVQALWRLELPFIMLGGGSNVLVSDAGVRQVVILNRAKSIRFEEREGSPVVWAESGANLGVIARQAAARGLPGLEWAAGIPGTLGGAVVGNAGAHGSDLAENLILAEILHRLTLTGTARLKGEVASRESWTVDRLKLSYRSSTLKSTPGEAVVLAALLRLGRSMPGNQLDIQARMAAFNDQRRRTQPPGASMGSMFKNPPGDFAGRLIEEAGLKGTRIGDAEISHLHANFFINHGKARAKDVQALVVLARRRVAEMYSVELETEIEFIGEW